MFHQTHRQLSWPPSGRWLQAGARLRREGMRPNFFSDFVWQSQSLSASLNFCLPVYSFLTVLIFSQNLYIVLWQSQFLFDCINLCRFSQCNVCLSVGIYDNWHVFLSNYFSQRLFGSTSQFLSDCLELLTRFIGSFHCAKEILNWKLSKKTSFRVLKIAEP